jgi:uncharacterized protein YaiL (DUF2058 family)
MFSGYPPQPNPSGNIAARRCQICGINWPASDEYARCECGRPTSVQTVKPDTLLEPLEAQRRIKMAKFEEWLEKESHADRLKREKEVTQKMDQNQQNTVHIKAQFEAVIAGGGFTDEDRNRYAVFEEKLPRCHIYKYIDRDDD